MVICFAICDHTQFSRACLSMHVTVNADCKFVECHCGFDLNELVAYAYA